MASTASTRARNSPRIALMHDLLDVAVTRPPGAVPSVLIPAALADAPFGVCLSAQDTGKRARREPATCSFRPPCFAGHMGQSLGRTRGRKWSTPGQAWRAPGTATGRGGTEPAGPREPVIPPGYCRGYGS